MCRTRAAKEKNLKRREAKKRAEAVARNILELSTETASTDIELAKMQASLARDVMLKYNVRFAWNLRRFYCHGCKRLVVPGVNARVRLAPGRHLGGRRRAATILLITCTDCGHVNRKPLEQA